MHESTPTAASGNNRPAGLRPVLGLFSAVAIVVGEMIGSGIFFKPSQVAANMGGYVGLILALWVVCGLVNLCGALALAELSAMFPQEGGTYIFLREAYGRLWSFLWCWTEFWVIRTGAIAALAAYSELSFEQTLTAIGHPFPTEQAGLCRTLLAIGLIALFGGLNVAGTLWGSAAQNVMTTIKVGFIVLLGVFPWLALRGEPVELGPLWPEAVDRNLLVHVGAALAAIMWAYDGWGNVTVLAEEVHQPEKTVPRALVCGVLLVTILYFGANLAYHLTLPVDAIAHEMIPAVAVGRKLLPGFGEPLIRSMLMISLAGALNGNILVGPRVLFAVSRDHRFLRFFSRLSPRSHVPVRATLALCGWAVLLILLAEIGRDPRQPLFDRLTNYCVFGGSIFYLSAVLAVFVLRRLRPDVPRPYRTWGYPLVPAVFVLSYVAFLCQLFASQPLESLLGLAFVALGVVVYGLFAGAAATSNTLEA